MDHKPIILIEDIVGFAEIAVDLKVHKNTVSRWYERKKSTRFPEPVKALTCGLLFDRTEVRDWFTMWTHTRPGYYSCGD